MKMKPVKDWRESYKWYSIWASIATVLISIAAMAQSVLPMWESLIDPNIYKYLVAATGTLTIVARLIDQGVSDEQDK